MREREAGSLTRLDALDALSTKSGENHEALEEECHTKEDCTTLGDIPVRLTEPHHTKHSHCTKSHPH